LSLQAELSQLNIYLQRSSVGRDLISLNPIQQYIDLSTITISEEKVRKGLGVS